MGRRKTLRQRIDSFAQRTYSDPLHMTNFITKKKPVAPANGRRSGLVAGGGDWLDAARRASAHTITLFMAATYGVGAGW